MAIFKSTAKPSISASAGSPTDIIAAGDVTSGRYGVLVGLSAVNKSVSAGDVTISLVKNGGTTSLICFKLPIPTNTGYEFEIGNKFVLEAGDRITAYASAANAFDVIASYMTSAQGT